jgi:hypothetical protein
MDSNGADLPEQDEVVVIGGGAGEGGVGGGGGSSGDASDGGTKVQWGRAEGSLALALGNDEVELSIYV